MEIQSGTAAEASGAAAEDVAFERMYRDNVAAIYRYVHRRCRDRALAEDITQDVFIAAGRMVDESRPITEGWLYRVARNRLIDVVRRDSGLQDRLRIISGDRTDVSDEPSVVEQVEVERALERLRPDHRIVLTLRYIDDLSVADLAEELGRTPKGVEALLTRARRALRETLEVSDA